MKMIRSGVALMIAVLVSTLLLASPALANSETGNGEKGDRLNETGQTVDLAESASDSGQSRGAPDQRQKDVLSEQSEAPAEESASQSSSPSETSSASSGSSGKKSPSGQGKDSPNSGSKDKAAGSGNSGSKDKATGSGSSGSNDKATGSGSSGSNDKATGSGNSGSKDKATSSGGSGAKDDGSGNSLSSQGSKPGKPGHGCDQANAGHTHDYASTCDGSASKNGNGGGSAGGKPCAGCVGAADNKNPPGQFPNGTDHNNGYECDGNSGVGKTNPAHTGCPPPPTTPVCDGDINTPGIQPCPPPPPPPAVDEDDVVRGELVGPTVDPDFVSPQVVTPDHVLEVELRPKAPLGAVLPFTGVDVVPAALLSSLGLISSGLAAMRRRRSF